MSDFFGELYGNEQLKTYIRSKISDGALPHALIFEGVDGSGKLTVATMTAQALEPKFADKIGRRQSPDVTVHELTDGKKSIGVSLIRDIRAAAFITPQELSVRIFIIRQAETMTVEAQNALLKILEEPPAGVYFFLLCANSSLMLPTVRSRAPVLKMSVLSDTELAEYLISVNKKAAVMSQNDRDAFMMTVRSCGGSIGAALTRIGSSDGQGEALRTKASELIDLLKNGKRDKIVLFFVKNKFRRDELDSVLLFISCAMRDMLKVKYGSLADTLYFPSVPQAEELSSEFARSTLMNIYTETESLRGKLGVNLNVDAFCVQCADILSDAAR
jgi:DNA polymerase-3 subunit delta'